MVSGYYVNVTTVGEQCKAFVPKPLPGLNDLSISFELREKLDRALLALGRLDSISLLLPDLSLFLYMYIRKEAVLSSQIEGTQSSLSDLLLFEHDMVPGVPLDDVQEVSNYVTALNFGIKKIHEGVPISSRLIREIHANLLSKGRGVNKNPGEFRASQNWIGGTRPGNAVFVPPPSDMVLECIGNLEKYINDVEFKTPVLIKAALSHVQFETIHPFLDGNGRVGRLLIPLILCEGKILKEPLLYLSLYLKANRNLYYDLLQRVRQEGNWETWIEFFADAVEKTATQAVQIVEDLEKLQKVDRSIISGLGRIAGSSLRVYDILLTSPLITPQAVCEQVRISSATANKVLAMMSEKNIINEVSGRQRNRLYVYDKYMQILNRDL